MIDNNREYSQIADSEISDLQVPVEKLRWTCDPSVFKFECTDTLVPLQEFVGQERALKSLSFALAVDRPGYNLFVTGMTGTGRMSAIQEYVRRAIEQRNQNGNRPQPYDWCYVHNFVDPDRPKSLQLPRGTGRNLKAGVLMLLTTLREQLNKAFDSKDFKELHESIEEDGRKRSQQLLHVVQSEAQNQGFLVQPSPTGILVIPLHNGQPMPSTQFLSLKADERRKLEEKQGEITQQVQEAAEKSHQIENETAIKLLELHNRTAEGVIGNPFKVLKENYKNIPVVVQFLDDLKNYTTEHIDYFFKVDDHRTQSPWAIFEAQQDVSTPFQINVIVDNGNSAGLPIVIEHHPTWPALFGKIERKAFAGTYRSDHSMLKPGALHMANGGYLILNIIDILSNTGSFEGLKRAIKTRQLRIEDLYEGMGLALPQGLRPEPIPLDVKVIVVGDSMTYHLLSRYDEEFWELFRVKADFDYEIDMSQQNLDAYAAFICGCCNTEHLTHFDPSAVARVAEYGVRLVSDQHKLSARFGQLKELVIEADHWARQRGHSIVSSEDVKIAIDEKVARSGLIADRILEQISDGTLMIDVDGKKAGQVNGLEVFEIGDLHFGKPVKITAKTFIGRQGVLNIERESRLSGRIHDKGVLIIGGYLGSKYAQSQPLGLSASLCFEQSYGEIDGDSASSTEVYAIVSSLSGIPIRQDIAVTGSINQHGEIQPIGGVNEKIEGFFDVCLSRGLTGTQGVIIPEQNVRHLMLKETVTDAVRRGQFHIYAVKTVDEGLQILMGARAGEKQADGSYTPGTINSLVEKRLREFVNNMRLLSDGKTDLPQP